MIEFGLGLAAISLAGRAVSRSMPQLSALANKMMNAGAWKNAKYHRGGFEGTMTKREAALILGVSPNAPAKKVSECHKKVMLLNHPDRGGSPYMAAKINQAKDIIYKK
jgi:DnaJ family protein C protein 19